MVALSRGALDTDSKQNTLRQPSLIPCIPYRIKEASLVIRPSLLNGEGPIQLLQ